MLKWFFRRRIDAFGRAWGYDVGYMREILGASLPAARRFAAVTRLAHHREDLPAAAWIAASLAALMAEDCGPCAQLVVKMAEAEGVDPAVLRAIVARDPARMGPDAVLGFRFAEASLRHDPEVETLREEVRRRWGERALVSLAFAIAGARVFPTVKYALGHGVACTRIRVGEAELPVLRRAA
jgi:alkylhydroperoxidase family enzyme